jgi:hypothetical protein
MPTLPRGSVRLGRFANEVKFNVNIMVLIVTAIQNMSRDLGWEGKKRVVKE